MTLPTKAKDLAERLTAWAVLVNENATAAVFVSDEFRAEHREKGTLLTEAAAVIAEMGEELERLQPRSLAKACIELNERAEAAEKALAEIQTIAANACDLNDPRGIYQQAQSALDRIAALSSPATTRT
jgi:hypothetical protein